MRGLTTYALILIALLIAACATPEMTVRVNLPATDAGQVQERPIFIRQVSDARTFAASSESPRQPSWGSNNTAFKTPEYKAHAVARNAQVGGKDFGGNVLLEGDQTVERMVKDATRTAFTKAGFSVITGGEQPEGIPVMDVRIEKLWGWFEYQRLSSTIASELEVRVTVTKPDGSSAALKTRSAVKESALHYNQANWNKTFDALMAAYIKGLEAEIKKQTQ